jgi:hypothetical protein
MGLSGGDGWLGATGAARRSYKARTGRGARRALGRGRNGGERKCAHASLASGSGRCMGYLTGQCVVQSPSPPSLSSVSDTQLASRNPTFAASAPRGHPSIHQARCGQRTGRSFAVGPTGRLVRKALLDSNGSGRPRAHHGATVTHGGARLDDRRALWIRSPVVQSSYLTRRAVLYETSDKKTTNRRIDLHSRGRVGCCKDVRPREKSTPAGRNFLSAWASGWRRRSKASRHLRV